MVVHGHDGLDEVSLAASSTVCEVADGRINSFFLDPRGTVPFVGAAS